MKPTTAPQSTISYAWNHRIPTHDYATGVSLHGHTCMSHETLAFLAILGREFSVLHPLFRSRERATLKSTGITLNYEAGYWTPPLTPHLAFDLECRQIEDDLCLPALVSLTDHDDIRAPLLLNSTPRTSAVPISFEWSVPYRDSLFHLGIHNLPPLDAAAWHTHLTQLTAELTASASPATLAKLTDTLSQLHALPDTLIVLNHPIWDLENVGAARYRACLDEFLTSNNQFIHAMEINGLRGWPENRAVKALAEAWNQLLISGGDRHGIEANAATNLTHATTFTEFVHEIRYERLSHIVLMKQYAEPCKYRILQSTIAVIDNYPDFPEGMQNWDDRVFHPDAAGNIRPVSQLWPHGEPLFVRTVLGGTRLLGKGVLSRALQKAWSDPDGLSVALSS